MVDEQKYLVMNRKDLYREMIKAVIEKTGLSEDKQQELKDDLELEKFTDVLCSLKEAESENTTLCDWIDVIEQKLAQLDSEEEVVDENNIEYVMSFEEVDSSRKIHFHDFAYNDPDISVIPACHLLHDKLRHNLEKINDGDEFWKAIERLWTCIYVCEEEKNRFFNCLERQDYEHYYLIKKNTITTESWRIYSAVCFKLAIEKGFPVPDMLTWNDDKIATMQIWDWENSYEQYHEAFNILCDVQRAKDVLTRFLRVYQVLEFFTFRFKLREIAKGQATRNSFIANVIKTVEYISKNELKSLQILFEKVFPNIPDIDVNEYVPDGCAKPAGTEYKLREYLKDTFDPHSTDWFELKSSSQTFNGIAEIIYKIRCCIVHSKESEMHFTPNNLDEYRELVPIMGVLIKVLQSELFMLINNHNRKELEFEEETMKLY